jgi:[ribosomal protein S5]-alanine N-acetyltransferase
MVFARASGGSSAYVVRGVNVGLRPLAMGDFAAWAHLRDVSRDHLTPYEPTWAQDELTKSAFRRRLRHHAREKGDDLGYAYGLFKLANHDLVGGVSLSNVRRGVTQTASLGYWMGQPHLRQGLMSDAVSAIIELSFDGLRLHRLEAATLLENSASITVLERNGFAREGLARGFLRINGEWRDHLLFGLPIEDRGQGLASSQTRSELART